jgi:hypothetical protein
MNYNVGGAFMTQVCIRFFPSIRSEERIPFCQKNEKKEKKKKRKKKKRGGLTSGLTRG